MRILFDLDGTLFQTEHSAVHAVKTLFEEMGLPPIDINFIRKSIGKTTDLFLRDILPDNVNPDEVRERFRKLEQESVREHGGLFADVREMLSILCAKGHELYICSSGSMEYIDLVLSNAGIDKYFIKKFSAKLLSKEELIKESRFYNRSTVFIGDTASDMKASKGNSIPSIAAAYGYGNRAELADATFIAETVKDIIPYICQLDVFAKIADRLILKDNRVIGINGIDTSGKTMFTNNFSRYLSDIGIKNTVLHVDDFHNPLKIRRQGNTETEAYYCNAFNYEQLIHEILLPLRRDGNIDKDVLSLNLHTDRYEKSIHYTVDKETVLLIEGTLLFRPPMNEYLDGKIYLHINFSEALKRATVRDVPKYGEAFLQKYIEKYMPVQKRYIEEHHPQEHSDIVVCNNNYLYPTILA